MRAGAADGLKDKRYVTAILRLLIDARGDLVHGEVTELDGVSTKRFIGWVDLVPTIKRWLASLEQDPS